MSIDDRQPLGVWGRLSAQSDVGLRSIESSAGFLLRDMHVREESAVGGGCGLLVHFMVPAATPSPDPRAYLDHRISDVACYPPGRSAGGG